MEEIKRKVSESTKKEVVNRQGYTCANKDGKAVEGYQCPLWKNGGNGIFDELGYDIDHIIEFCISHNDDIDNLQALCKYCHLIKTKRFMKEFKKKKKDEFKRIDESDSDTVDDIESSVDSNSDTESDESNTDEVDTDNDSNASEVNTNNNSIDKLLCGMSTNVSKCYNSKYWCPPCDYSSKDKNEYKKHTETCKHIHNIDLISSVIDTHICNICCGIFSCRQSLHKHKEKCDITKNLKNAKIFYEKIKSLQKKTKTKTEKEHGNTIELLKKLDKKNDKINKLIEKELKYTKEKLKEKEKIIKKIKKNKK